MNKFLFKRLKKSKKVIEENSKLKLESKFKHLDLNLVNNFTICNNNANLKLIGLQVKFIKTCAGK